MTGLIRCAKYFGCCILLSLSLLAKAQEESSSPHWLGGVAKVDITPVDTMWMAGYASRTGPATAILHRIWAKALALQDSTGLQAVLVTMDLVGLPKGISDNIRNRLRVDMGLQRNQIILNSSHTHSGPVLKEALSDIYPMYGNHPDLIKSYSASLEDSIVELVHNAFSALQPVNIFAGNGVSRIQVNRRNNVEKKLTIQSELRGPNDYAVPVLKICNLNGDKIAVAFGYACHPTVLDTTLWSGDYPGFAQLELEKNHPGSMALFFQGAGADQNPLPRRTIPLAKQYGRSLAVAVDRVLEENMSLLAPKLQVSYQEIELGINNPPTEAELVEYIDSTAKGYQLKWAERMLSLLRSGHDFPKSYPYPIQVWRMGDQAIFSLGGEVVVNYAIHLKEIFGRDVFVMGYSNDVMGYIPSATILHEGGYEGCTSQMVYGMSGTWKYDSAQKILQGLVDMAKDLNVMIPENKLIRLKKK